MVAVQNIYCLPSVPVLQNRVFDTPDAARNCATGELQIVQNLDTGLIYNQAFDASRLIYDKNYNNEQSLSPAFQSHLKLVKEIVRKFLGTSDLLEVGCGKAYFLEMLRADGFDILGCDPTYEGSNRDIVRDFYHCGLGLTKKNLILRHVLEHIADPVSFLEGVRDANQGGTIYIEVPCLDWIANRHAWFDLFYEHVNYFRLSDLTKMFGRVYDSGRIFGGQYLYIVADLQTIQRPMEVQTPFSLPDGFQPNFTGLDRRVTNVVWGAASKGVIYSLHAQRSGYDIAFAIDVNPAKHEKYLPLTGIRVLSPEKAIRELSKDTHVVIMNSNYRDEIVEMSKNKFSYTVADNE